MQPYLFPYIGYFQQMNLVDKYVLFDDVQWIRGWINRHELLLNGSGKLTTLSVEKHSNRCLINEVNTNEVALGQYLYEIRKLYHKAPYFEVIYPMLEDVLFCKERNLVKIILNTFVWLNDLFDMKTEFLLSSNIDYNRNTDAENKILDICKKNNAKVYINTIKGQHLYDREKFKSHELKLYFFDRIITPYEQYSKNDFVPYLSIIDVLMFNDVQTVKEMIKLGNLI